MITLFDLLIVVAILGFAYRGWIMGLQAASIEALELLACLSVAVMTHEAVAGFLHAGFALVFGDGISTSWSILLAFGLLAWGPFAALRLLVHRLPSADDENQEEDVDPLGDRVAGAVAGGFGGAVFVGGALVTLSMVPFLAGLKPSGDRMLLDVGKTILRAAGQFARESHEGRVLPLWGEPPSRIANLAARLTSEPWFDVDDDGACTETDRFRDVDGNGTFSKDLYYEDVDGDGVRRIGLIDKYVVGRWDAELISNDRPRPDLKKETKPAAGAPAPKPAPPIAKPPTPAAKPAPPAAKPATPETKPAAPETKPPATQAKPAASDPRKPAAEKPKDGKPKDGKPVPGDEVPAEPATEKRPDDDF